MVDSVLYFPSISLPQNDWFTRVLLYWDRVGTIVPTQFLEDPSKLRPNTAELLALGLVTVVSPDENIWKVGASKYYTSFLSLLDSRGIRRRKRKLPFKPHQPVRIHVDKTGHGLAHELQERGAASFVSAKAEDDAWFYVEKEVGDLLMAYLATILGQQEEQPMVPITDSADCLQAFARIPIGEGRIEERLDPIRTEILSDILPAPVEGVEPQDLADFRQRHGKLLRGFRCAVEQRVVSAAAIQDPELRRRQIELIRRDLKEQLEEISRRMTENMWQRIGWGTLLAVSGTATTALDPTASGFAIAGGVMSLVGAAYDAIESASKRKTLLSTPMAYAALAQQKLGDIH
jgi:hypothetical protein